MTNISPQRSNICAHRSFKSSCLSVHSRPSLVSPEAGHRVSASIISAFTKSRTLANGLQSSRLARPSVTSGGVEKFCTSARSSVRHGRVHCARPDRFAPTLTPWRGPMKVRSRSATAHHVFFPQSLSSVSDSKSYRHRKIRLFPIFICVL